MRRRSIAWLCGALLACRAGAPARPATPWPDRAASAQRSLVDGFYDEATGLFANACPRAAADPKLHYWWQAHAIDALVDAFERDHDPTALARAARIWASVKRANDGVTNDYYDDMLWMGLALHRLGGHTHDPALRADVQTLWRDVRCGWNEEQGGGIAWRKTQRDYKNTPANAPAVLLGVALHRDEGDGDALAFARRVYDWLDGNLVDRTSGLVWDGKNRRGDGRIDRDWLFTYNQGLFIGAAVALFEATREPRYRADAAATLAAMLARMTDADGVLRENGRGDGGLFKGILVRNLGAFAAADPGVRDAVHAFLRRQAESMWSHAVAPAGPTLFPCDWRTDAAPPTELSAELSGVMLLEQLAKLE